MTALQRLAMTACLCAGSAEAQPARAHEVAISAAGRWARPAFVGGWVAGAMNSTFSTAAGTLRRDFLAAGIGAAWTIASARGVAVTYLGDIIPVAVTTNIPSRYDMRSCGPGSGDCYTLVAVTRTVIGAGAAPLGIQVELRPRAPVSLSLHANGGILFFARPVPDPGARHLNFTAAAGAALELALAKTFRASLGYARHHTSNGGSATANPGLNSHMLVLGLVHERERR